MPDNALLPHSAAPSDPVDFYAHTGRISTAGTLDVLTRSVTEGAYAHESDLLRFASIMSKGALTAADADELKQMPRPVVRMTGSSTEQDLDGDIMYPSAIQDMTQCKPNMSLFLNHSYNLPQDLFGSLVGSPWTKSQSGITDLWLQSDVETINPAAVQTYLYVTRGRDIGVSGGFMILEAEYVDRATGKPVSEDDLSFEDIIFGGVTLGIAHVKAVEFSTVGIPSNQRSWVEAGAKGYFQRTGSPLLAPIVRSLYPNKWTEILASSSLDESQRKHLEDVQPRQRRHDTPAIYYAPLQGQFTVQAGKRARALTRAEVAQLLTTSVPSVQQGALHEERDMPHETLKAAASDDDKKAQEARSKKYHIGIKDDTNVTKPGAFKDVPDSEWGDPVNYSYPMPDKAHADAAASRWGDESNRVDYTQAEQDIISARIEKRQADFGESSDDAKSGKSADDATLVEKGVEVSADGTHAAFRGTHTHAHKAFDSQGDDATHEHEHTHDGDANHDHAHAKHAPVDVTKASDGVELDDDGGHAPMSGRHAHAHKAYGMPDADGNGMHQHEHEHKGEANHGHDHYGADGHDGGPKSGEPDATKAANGGDDIGEKACPSCHMIPPDSVTGNRCPNCTHCLKCGGHVPAEAMKCASCGASMGGEKAAEPEKAAPADATPTASTTLPLEQRTALLSSYNQLGAMLGFAPAALDSTSAAAAIDSVKGAVFDSPDDAQKAVELISQIDRITDVLAQVNLNRLDGLVDDLMELMHVPDIDDLDDGEQPDAEVDEGYDEGAGAVLVSGPMYAGRAARGTVRKEGKRNSAGDLADMQAIHDAVCRLTDGSVCQNVNMQPQGDNTPAEGGAGESEADARGELAGANGAMGANTHNTRAATALDLAPLSDLSDSLKSLGGALGGIDVKALHEHVTSIQDALTKAQAASDTLAQQQAALVRKQQEIAEQQAALAEQVEVLGNVKLPRPTRISRSVDLSDPVIASSVATYADMRAAGGDMSVNPSLQPLTLDEALARTEVKTLDGVQYRYWPAGVVPADGRPELSNFQKQITNTSTLLAYRNGDECYVPLLGEQLPVTAN